MADDNKIHFSRFASTSVNREFDIQQYLSFSWFHLALTFVNSRDFLQKFRTAHQRHTLGLLSGGVDRASFKESQLGGKYKKGTSLFHGVYLSSKSHVFLFRDTI